MIMYEKEEFSIRQRLRDVRDVRDAPKSRPQWEGGRPPGRDRVKGQSR